MYTSIILKYRRRKLICASTMLRGHLPLLNGMFLASGCKRGPSGVECNWNLLNEQLHTAGEWVVLRRPWWLSGELTISHRKETKATGTYVGVGVLSSGSYSHLIDMIIFMISVLGVLLHIDTARSLMKREPAVYTPCSGAKKKICSEEQKHWYLYCFHSSWLTGSVRLEEAECLSLYWRQPLMNLF
jgi:hypothetical protein